MKNALTCDLHKIKASWEKPNPNLSALITIIKHTHKTLLQCNEDAMHEHITTDQYNSTQKFPKKNLTNLQVFKTPKTQKCMKKM